MAFFKCKMCGGALDIAAGASVIECEYCGTKQTLPRLDDDRRANLYDRANHFRRNNDFDKAMGIYEQILNEDSTDAEAYWSLVLCRYGIEYVKDPASGRRIPTVNRAQFTSIFDDNNYRSAIKYADTAQKALYEEEANAINEIQKGILAISQNEEPFDVFICYKENDAHGGRTHDSVLAQELYYQLKNEGFKVFFARITLEDKLGSAYEPYIFAALNSAKVMVVIGTNPEHFAAPWVKNEWSRYLGLVKQGQKKVLIPAYRDMDPYDLPDEFSHLQAQDMAKLGFMQDLVRGIKKIAKAEEPKSTVVKETVVKEAVAGNAANNVAAINITPLLQRAFIFIEDGDFRRADEFLEQVLNQNPQNGEAYLGKLMVELHVNTKEGLKNCFQPFNNSNNYQKIMRYGDDDIKAFVKGCVDNIYARIEKVQFEAEQARLENIYRNANYLAQNNGDDLKNLSEAINLYNTIKKYKDSEALCDLYTKKRDDLLERKYLEATKAMEAAKTEDDYYNAAGLFFEISGYKDSHALVGRCEELANQEKAKRRKARKKKALIISLSSAVSAIALILLTVFVFVPNILVSSGQYKTYIDLYQVTDFEVPEGVTSIGYEAFEGCTSLTSVEIPDSVASIGDYAFSGCTSLTSVVIGDSVTSIGDYAFSGCTSLTSVEIGDSVTSIGNHAFAWCESLTSIKISGSVESFGTGAYYDNESFESVELEGTYSSTEVFYFESVEFEDIDSGSSTEVVYEGTSYESIEIPNSVTSIGKGAFKYCSSLTSVVIPDSVTSIGDEAFYGCRSLTSIKYRGTKEQWNAIYKGYWWNSDTGKYTITCNYTGE